MRRVIVRTPETDRKGIDIPTQLADLTDYATVLGPASGTATSNAGQAFDTGTPTTIALNTYTGLVNTEDDGADGLRVLVAGMYAIEAFAGYTTSGFASLGAPFQMSRTFKIYVNGIATSMLAGSDGYVGSSTVDRYNWMYRLAADDVVTIVVEQTTGFNYGVVGGLSVNKIAS